MISPEAIAYIPVPSDRLTELLAVVADALRQDNGGEEAEQGVRQRRWTRELIHRLHEEVSNLAVRTVLDLCAERPGVWVSIRDVEQSAGLSMPTVRAGMAGFTMFLKARFQASNWPLDWQFTEGAVHYRLAPDIARWWGERVT